MLYFCGVKVQRQGLLKTISGHLADKRHTILIGARQVGKTTLIQQLYDDKISKKQKAWFLSFESPEILDSINTNPENIFSFTMQPQELKKGERIYLFIDEIQYAANPTNFLKLIFDKYAGKVKVIATGSSAFYIDRNFKDSLAGRKKIFEIYTLSFDEFLLFKGRSDLAAELERVRKSEKNRSLLETQVKALFNEYLIYGGYPAVVLEKDVKVKEELLKDLVQSYMKKDVLESGLRHDLQFFELARILASQTGNLVNTNELANTLKLSAPTIDNYLYLLQKSYHIHLLPPKFGNLRKELSKMPKLYFNDSGLRNALVKNFSPLSMNSDKGALLENYVYTRIRNKYGLETLKYWRTADGNEVDFIVEESFNKGFAVEVKYNQREFKPTKYKKFTEHYPQFPLEVWSYENPESYLGVIAK